MYDSSLVTKERLEELRAKRNEMYAIRFCEAEKIIGKENADALRYLYSIYNEGMYLWIANLWEPEIGAFYYSNSGRDTEGFLPDIESTMQAMGFLSTSGIFSAKDGEVEAPIYEKMKESICNYAKGLQDPDGYFYHPQWGKDITTSRRGRDLGWSMSAIRDYGGTPNYPSPLDKKSASDDAASLLPEHLQSVDNLKKYLSELDLANRSYWVGNLIQSQARQIIAAGKEFVDTVVEWYYANQNSDNGLWQSEVCYSATNGLMKVCLAMSAFGVRIPNPEKAMHSCFEIMLKEGGDALTTSITSFYNPWITVKMLFDNMEKFGDNELAEKLKVEFMQKAAAMIRSTTDKVVRFRKPDGSFSYGQRYSSATSQSAPVATPETAEGDINGNGLSSTGVIRNVCLAMGVPIIPFYTKEDGEFFFELIAKSYPSTKIYKKS